MSLLVKLNHQIWRMVNTPIGQVEPSNMENGKHPLVKLNHQIWRMVNTPIELCQGCKKWIVSPCMIFWKGLTNNLKSEIYIQN
jgi:hypothetical protein